MGGYFSPGCWAGPGGAAVTRGCCCHPGGCCILVPATMLSFGAGGGKRHPQVGARRRISKDAPRHRHPSPSPLGPKRRESHQHNPVLDTGESTLSTTAASSQTRSSFPNLHPPNSDPGMLLGSPNLTSLPGRTPGALLLRCLPAPPPPRGSAGGRGWPRIFTTPLSQHPLGRLTAASQGEVPVHL